MTEIFAKILGSFFWMIIILLFIITVAILYAIYATIAKLLILKLCAIFKINKVRARSDIRGFR